MDRDLQNPFMSRATKHFGFSLTARAEIFQDGPPGKGSKFSANPQRAILFRQRGQGERCPSVQHRVGEL